EGDAQTDHRGDDRRGGGQLFETAKSRKSENAKSGRIDEESRRPGREQTIDNLSFLVSWIPHRNAGPLLRLRSARAQNSICQRGIDEPQEERDTPDAGERSDLDDRGRAILAKRQVEGEWREGRQPLGAYCRTGDE